MDAASGLQLEAHMCVTPQPDSACAFHAALPLTTECVLLLQNVFSAARLCSDYAFRLCARVVRSPCPGPLLANSCVRTQAKMACVCVCAFAFV